MYKIVNLIGQRSHSLTIIGKAEKDTRLNRIMWRAKCDCGKEIKVCTGDWNAGRAKSCGCYRKRTGADHPNFRHGLTQTADYQYNQSLKKRYGLTFEAYELLCEMQNHVCAICGNKQNDKRGTRLVVDHCHTTKRIRGLLCNKCNRAIGLLRENTNVMRQAINYIKRNEVQIVSAK